MVEKTVSVALLVPGETLIFENVEVTYHDKETIRFTERDETDDEQVTVTDYTSNAPYLVTETMTGPKSLL
jgi:hypothetical protein